MLRMTVKHTVADLIRMVDAFTAWLLYMSIQLGTTRTSVCWCTMSAELPMAARRSACLYLACSFAAAVGCVGPGMGTGLGVGLGADLGWGWDWGMAAAAGSFAFCKQAKRTVSEKNAQHESKAHNVGLHQDVACIGCLSGVHEYRAGNSAHLSVLVQLAALLWLRLLQRRRCGCPAAHGSAQKRLLVAGLELGDGCRLRGRRLGRRDGHGLGRGRGRGLRLGLGGGCRLLQLLQGGQKDRSDY